MDFVCHSPPAKGKSGPVLWLEFLCCQYCERQAPSPGWYDPPYALQEATIKDLRNELADKEVALQNAQRKLFQVRASRCELFPCIAVGS